MNWHEIIGVSLVAIALVLAAISLFIPRIKIIRVENEAIPETISGHFILLKTIHNIPFWMLNSYGKTLRVAIDVSAIMGLFILSISFWTG